MSARKVISCGLIAGMNLDAIRRSPPGFVIDMYRYRQEYDFRLYGLRRKKAGE